MSLVAITLLLKLDFSNLYNIIFIAYKSHLIDYPIVIVIDFFANNRNRNRLTDAYLTISFFPHKIFTNLIKNFKKMAKMAMHYMF